VNVEVDTEQELAQPPPTPRQRQELQEAQKPQESQ